jgi:hypothetical protein
MDHTPKEIVFNLPHPSIILYISDSPSRTILLHLVQEIKRDIIHCRMTITSQCGPIPLLRIHASQLLLRDSKPCKCLQSKKRRRKKLCHNKGAQSLSDGSIYLLGVQVSVCCFSIFEV